MSNSTFFIPDNIQGDVQVFTSPSTVTNLQWLTWKKPLGVTMCRMIVIGGGGGGGGGFTGVASSARGGGGGGGGSGVSISSFPTFLIPDILYVQVGAGGAGVGSGGAAGSGVLSYVSIAPSNVAANTLAVSGAAAAGGGGTGTAAAVGAAGTASTSMTASQILYDTTNLLGFLAGQTGSAGGAVAGAVGGSVAIPINVGGVFCMGGAGGAGTTSADFAGGGVTAIAGSLLSSYAPAVAPGTAGSNNGSGGPTIWQPMFFFSGLGGGASNTGVGGAGGNGSYGSGGGGGGGGTTGGRGGDGGQGIVIINCW